MSEPTTIAVDLAKSVFQVAVSRRPGRVETHRRLTRSRMLEFFAQQPPAHVVMEACGSAHFWARQLGAMGHQVTLLPAQHVRKYRLGAKPIAPIAKPCSKLRDVPHCAQCLPSRSSNKPSPPSTDCARDG